MKRIVEFIEIVCDKFNELGGKGATYCSSCGLELDSSAVPVLMNDVVYLLHSSCLEKDTDTGFYGELVGLCPLCGNKVIRDRYGYSCQGYKDGCKFKINDFICGRVISKNNVIKLLQEGSSSKIEGFISKSGKKFDAYLVLENDKINFKF